MNTEHAIERMREMVANKTPFVHQGRDPVNGIDCIGALAYAFQWEPPLPAYPRDPVNGELERNLQKEFGPPILERPQSNDVLRALDLVSMQYRGPSRHVALIVPHINLPGVLSIIHTDSMVERVVEHILDDKWRRRIVKVWRL